MKMTEELKPGAFLDSLKRTAKVMRTAHDSGGNRWMSIWTEDVQAVEEAVTALESPQVVAPAEREPTDAQLIVDQQRMINQLREWRSAILAKCKASDGFDRLDWGSGDKDGWGFVHYFIGHLETRALQAEKDLALRQSPAASVDLTNHHNALICPYCNPKGLKFAEPTSSAALEPFLRFAEQNTDENGWLSSIHRESISTWFGPSEFRALLALRSQPETVSQRELAINLLGWSSSEKAAAVLLSKFNVTRKTTEEPRG
jgi:hypothetical protein